MDIWNPHTGTQGVFIIIAVFKRFGQEKKTVLFFKRLTKSFIFPLVFGSLLHKNLHLNTITQSPSAYPKITSAIGDSALKSTKFTTEL